ncbi:hypothetical protein [Paenibacillus thermotolerans]|uniref:hypothetical protein n=1 Tax=Paenibacillus thermotolerans TaxID=3027807 RepID=UPI002367C9B3|nr:MULTISPECIES: hypothetical protein [unclassified Paenibacillus]
MAPIISKPHINIGIIGPKPFVHSVLQRITAFPTFVPTPAVAEQEEEALAAAERLQREVEVILVPGPYVHKRMKEKLPSDVSVIHIPITGSGLIKALFRMSTDGSMPSRFSIDSMTELAVSKTLKDIKRHEQTQFICYDGPAYASKVHLIRFHMERYEAGVSGAAFTGVKSVAEELAGRGIPAQWLEPAEQDMVVSLERALLSTETRRMKESQIVVGMVSVDDFEQLALKRGNEHGLQKLKLDIQRMMLDYVESLEGYLSHTGGEEYLFFTTRGVFERETGGYKAIPLAKDTRKTYGITLSIGIGFGLTASGAGTNARTALRKAKEAGGNTCFILREDKTLIGPLEMGEPVEQVMSLTDPELLRQAEDAGMTSAYLTKLLNQSARAGKVDYMVHELAQLLDITVRSAHRLLEQWMDNGLVEIAGIEKVPRGRPRQIFRFSFLLNNPYT